VDDQIQQLNLIYKAEFSLFDGSWVQLLTMEGLTPTPHTQKQTWQQAEDARIQHLHFTSVTVFHCLQRRDQYL